MRATPMNRLPPCCGRPSSARRLPRSPALYQLFAINVTSGTLRTTKPGPISQVNFPLPVTGCANCR